MADIRYEQEPRGNRMMVGIIVAALIVLAVVAAFAFGLVGVKQTREAEAPKVSVEGGQAPAFDVDTAKVDVGTKATTVDVPKVKVDTSRETVKVPTVDIQKAN